MANEYLKRTPTSTGNRKIWSFSFWVKRNSLAAAGAVFYTNQTSQPYMSAGTFNANGSFQAVRNESASVTELNSEALFRDVGNWMNILIAFDSTNTIETRRTKLYVNGVLIPFNSSANYASLNYLSAINRMVEHNIGIVIDTSANQVIPFKGELFDLFFIDGQALTPDVFGFFKDGKGYQSSGTTEATDFRPGQWSPHSPRKIKTEIERKGGFGVNGFYLPMNDSSNPGADFHTTPNSIITLKGEDLPQPRNGAPTTSDAYVSQLRTDPYAANLVLAVPGVELENTNPELVTNGDFSNGTTGWTGLSGGSLSVEDGKLKITETTNALDAYAVNSTAITTVVGRRYTIKWTFHEGTNTTFTVRFGNSGNQSQEYQSNTGANGYGSYPDPGTYSFTFTATATTLNLSFIVNQASSYGYVSNVSVKEAVAVRDYSADIKGSGTNKTVTGVGLAGVYPVPSYYGSALSFDGYGDHFTVAASSDFVYGSGDFTIEFWWYPTNTTRQALYHGSFGADYSIGIDYNSTATNTIGIWASSNGSSWNLINADGGGNGIGKVVIPQNQWSHFVYERRGNQWTSYVNGVADVTVDVSGTVDINASDIQAIGAWWNSETAMSDVYGYLQDFRIYKGVAKYKGGFDVPKPYTPVGIESWRQVPDTCKNNFATLNSIDNNSGVLSNGNLTYVDDSSNGWNNSRATIGASSGKWYWEVRADEVISTVMCMSVAGAAGNDSTNGARLGYLPGQSDDAGVTYYPNGRLYHADSQPSGQVGWGATYDDGDIIGIALDMDDSGGKVWFAKNNSWQGSGNPATGANPARNNLKTYADTWFPISGTYYGNTAQTFNFGQNPSFSGTTTAGTYTDSNGKGLFKYQPPTGYLALCEDNLPTPAIADPGEHFKTVLYTGDGNASRSVRGLGFKPDLVWIKRKNGASDHVLQDSVRGFGPTTKLASSSTQHENDTNSGGSYGITDPQWGYLTSVDEDGFSLSDTGTADQVNYSGSPYVAWCWKAGGPAVSNTDGGITAQVSANQTAGFSIVSWTGNGSNGATLGHGLGKRPSWVLVKDRDNSRAWYVWVDDLTGSTVNNGMTLNTNAGVAGFGHGHFTSLNNSTMTLTQGGSSLNNHNQNNTDYIAYCWAEIEGFSKFGSYIGNGNADGPFVYCGFKPAWVMVKCSSAGGRNWRIWDSSRGPTNPTNIDLLANTADAENSYSSDEIDLLSNGFKIRSTGSWHNTSGETYIVAAFAESPFQTANAK